MNQIQNLQNAEADGLTVTLTPEELSQLNQEIDSWIEMYKRAAEDRDKLRLVALDARGALTGYNRQSPMAERISNVVWGRE